jgi:hypothetical protein
VQASRSEGKKPLNPLRIKGLAVLVAWGGIEPPTRGFSMLEQVATNQQHGVTSLYNA